MCGIFKKSPRIANEIQLSLGFREAFRGISPDSVERKRGGNVGGRSWQFSRRASEMSEGKIVWFDGANIMTGRITRLEVVVEVFFYQLFARATLRLTSSRSLVVCDNYPTISRDENLFSVA